MNGILQTLAEGPEGLGKVLVEHCQEILKGQYYGGALVDSAVNAVFAALVWNSQDCREELETLGGNRMITDELLKIGLIIA